METCSYLGHTQLPRDRKAHNHRKHKPLFKGFCHQDHVITRWLQEGRGNHTRDDEYILK